MKSIYSIYDLKAQTFGMLHLVSSPAAFYRDLADYVRRDEGPMGRHPADFQVCMLGWLNEETGVLDPAQDVVRACTLADLLATE